MEASPRSRPSGPKCAALIGPMSSGKTTLLEAILARTGAIPRQHSVASGNMVGFGSPEARAHGMSVEATVATVSNQGDSLTLIDCPGSVEYAYEAEPVLRFCDFAIVVVEADEKKLPALQLTLRRLDEIGLPRVLFLNKIDKAAGSVQQTLQMLQTASENPCCCGRFRSGKTEPLRDVSTLPSSAPTPTDRMPRRKSPTSGKRTGHAKKMPGLPCWKHWLIMTMC